MDEDNTLMEFIIHLLKLSHNYEVVKYDRDKGYLYLRILDPEFVSNLKSDQMCMKILFRSVSPLDIKDFSAEHEPRVLRVIVTTQEIDDDITSMAREYGIIIEDTNFLKKELIGELVGEHIVEQYLRTGKLPEYIRFEKEDEKEIDIIRVEQDDEGIPIFLSDKQTGSVIEPILKEENVRNTYNFTSIDAVLVPYYMAKYTARVMYKGIHSEKQYDDSGFVMVPAHTEWNDCFIIKNEVKSNSEYLDIYSDRILESDTSEDEVYSKMNLCVEKKLAREQEEAIVDNPEVVIIERKKIIPEKGSIKTFIEGQHFVIIWKIITSEGEIYINSVSGEKISLGVTPSN